MGFSSLVASEMTELKYICSGAGRAVRAAGPSGVSRAWGWAGRDSPTRRQQRRQTEWRAGMGRSSCKRHPGEPRHLRAPASVSLHAPWDGDWTRSPCRQDGVGVAAGADVLRDVGVGLTRRAQQGVVGFADRQEEGCVVARGQLDDVGHQGCGTQAEHVDACGVGG